MLRQAVKEDIADIAKIEKACFAEAWSEQMLEDSFLHGCRFIVCEANNKIVGYGGLYNTGDITNIAVLSEYRGQGLGNEIVCGLLDLAKEENLQTLFLEVRVSNVVAIKLYEKFGFKQIDTRKKYYKDGEDALIYAFGGV